MMWMTVVAATKPQRPIKCVYNSCGEAAPMLMAAARPPLEETGGSGGGDVEGWGVGSAVWGPGLLINKPKEFNFGFRSAPVHPSPSSSLMATFMSQTDDCSHGSRTVAPSQAKQPLRQPGSMIKVPTRDGQQQNRYI